MWLDNFRRHTRFTQYTSAGCGKENDFYLLIFMRVVGILQLSVVGNILWGTPTLPLLMSDKSPIGRPLTNEEASWVISILMLGMLPGVILLGFLIDTIGPKRTLLLTASSTVLSWTIMGFGKSFNALLIGRFIAGLGDGIAISCINIYLCEIASNDIRGLLGTIPVVSGAVAVLFMVGGGPYLSYTALIICAGVFPTTFLIIFPFMPDSPYFLIKKGRNKDAANCIKRLSTLATTPAEIELILRDMEDTVKRDESDEKLLQSLDRNFWKSLATVMAGQCLLQLSGVSFIYSYLQIILASSTLSMPKELVSVSFSVCQIFPIFLVGLLVDKFGRRPLLCISSLGSGTALILQGAYMYLNQFYNMDKVGFLPAIFLLAFLLFVTFGITYIPELIPGELFTSRTRKIGIPPVMLFSSFLGFVVTKASGSLFESLGFYTLLWFFGAACYSGILFSLYVLPETKGKSFNDIQKTLSNVHNERVLP